MHCNLREKSHPVDVLNKRLLITQSEDISNMGSYFNYGKVWDPECVWDNSTQFNITHVFKV